MQRRERPGNVARVRPKQMKMVSDAAIAVSFGRSTKFPH